MNKQRVASELMRIAKDLEAGVITPGDYIQWALEAGSDVKRALHTITEHLKTASEYANSNDLQNVIRFSEKVKRGFNELEKGMERLSRDIA